MLSTTFGSGNGSTTFNLPDLRGRVVAGVDNMGGSAANRLAGFTLAAAAGLQTPVLLASMLPPHTHAYFSPNGAGTYNTAGGGLGAGLSAAITDSGPGSSAGYSAVQPTMALNKIIFAGRA